MADPRYTDSRDTDSRDSDFRHDSKDVATAPHRNFGAEKSPFTWVWIAGIVALVAIAGLVIGYDRSDTGASSQSDKSVTTTGSAPAVPPRPASPTNAAPSTVQSPAPAEGPR